MPRNYEAGGNWTNLLDSEDLLLCSKDPIEILRGLEALYPLKGISRLKFYLVSNGNMTRLIKGHLNTLSVRTSVNNACGRMDRSFETSSRSHGSSFEGGINQNWIGQVS